MWDLRCGLRTLFRVGNAKYIGIHKVKKKYEKTNVSVKLFGVKANYFVTNSKHQNDVRLSIYRKLLMYTVKHLVVSHI